MKFGNFPEIIPLWPLLGQLVYLKLQLFFSLFSNFRNLADVRLLSNLYETPKKMKPLLKDFIL